MRGGASQREATACRPQRSGVERLASRPIQCRPTPCRPTRVALLGLTSGTPTLGGMDLRPRLPPAGPVELPGRGRTWVYDTASAGTASAVLLLHGWTSSAAINWHRCFEPLADRRRVIALDHRGHGRGIRSRRPFSLEDCADDAAALAEQLGIAPLTVVGYSMGGPVALLMWRRHPESVSGLVLCATAADFGPMPKWSGGRGELLKGASVALGHVPQALRRRGMRYLASRWSGPGTAGWVAEEWSMHDPAALLRCGVALARYDVTGWLGEIDVPTAVVLTESDRTVAPWRQRALADAIPGALTFPVAGSHRVCSEDHRRFVPALSSAVDAVAADPVAKSNS